MTRSRRREPVARIAVALGCLALLGAATGCGKDDPSETAAARGAFGSTEAGGALALWRTVYARGPRYDIVAVNADGTGLRVITGESVRRGVRPQLFGQVSWSPDGSKIAFAADLGTEPAGFPIEYDIYTVNADGSGLRRLTKTLRSFGPVWSPDGRTIAFARWVGSRANVLGTATIWLMDADGRNQRRVFPDVRRRFDVPGSWSPDGSSLAFTRSRHTLPGPDGRVRNTGAVWIVRSDGSGARKLAGRSASPAWSPDGQRIAYVTDRDENGELSYGDAVSFANELYVSGVDGRNPRRLTRTKDLNEAAPSWSPDGGWIAYQRGEVVGNAEGTIVLRVKSDGSCPTRIAADPRLDTWYAAPAWRPGTAGGGTGLGCR